ncbi:RNA polymerase sigma factor [Microbacterium sp. 3J1]|uniref:RNA polymerase sigma factor n=1 Tax=Microbacterium sp. 3J1 TaxID=861269 RepID=UPI000B19508D|nr:sigma-70 family RNA polymerase sigma factor [Microbacterium sp. 3J1]
MRRSAVVGALVFAGVATGPTPMLREPEITSRSDRSGPSARDAKERRREAVFRELFDQYWPRVRRHLDCFLDNRDEVDELTAEVFVIAWRKLDPERPLPFSWFLRTANNKLRDRSRTTRSRERAIDAIARGLDNPDVPLDPGEVLALRQAIASLNARERQVVALTYWDELSAGEVAEVLRTSRGAVWATLTRARKKLRMQLDGGAT